MFGRDRKGGAATVVARQMDEDSGFKFGQISYYKFTYVLDIVPEDGGPPFRTKALISLPSTTEFDEPDVGDKVRVTYKGAGDDVKFDESALRAAARAAKGTRAAELDALAAQSPGTAAPSSTPVASLDPDLQQLMDAEERERSGS